MAGHERWAATLDLSFARRGHKTLLARRAHRGPLLVQKALYPEGPEVCHLAVLHPPGGIAGGDTLTVRAQLEPQARVCLTTAGASKWYRCPTVGGEQHSHFSLAAGAALEWLPRESILFDASKARMGLDVDLAGGARFLGWDIVCFGRRASGERWRTGGLEFATRIRRAGALLWSERADILAGRGFESSPVALAGYSVSGTFVAAGAEVGADLLGVCRAAIPCGDGRAGGDGGGRGLEGDGFHRGDGGDRRMGVTATPRVLLARYLGHSAHDALRWFASLWSVLRPALLGRPATPLRLWAC